jgi:YD repeat-containing protein
MTAVDTEALARKSNPPLSVGRGGQSRSLGYDAAGNVTSDTRFDGTVLAYGYDDAGRLATVTRNGLAEASYGYDAFQRRVVKTAGGVTTHFLHDADGHLLAEATGAGATTTE